jgi:hypothetical protein
MHSQHLDTLRRKIMVTDNRCKVCTHPRRSEIELAILSHVSQLKIAAQFGLGSQQPVQSHKENHLPRELQEAITESERHRAQDLLDQLMHMNELVYEIFIENKEGGDHRTALMANREYNRNLSLFGQFTGDLRQPMQITVEATDTDDVLRRLLPEAFIEGELVPPAETPLLLLAETIEIEAQREPVTVPRLPAPKWPLAPVVPTIQGPLPGIMED